MRNQAAENGRGHIINIASMAALTPVPGVALYSASKFAVRGYSLSIVHELREQGIALTVVCPASGHALVQPYKHNAQAALLFLAPLLTVEKLVRKSWTMTGWSSVPWNSRCHALAPCWPNLPAAFLHWPAFC